MKKKAVAGAVLISVLVAGDQTPSQAAPPPKVVPVIPVAPVVPAAPPASEPTKPEEDVVPKVLPVLPVVPASGAKAPVPSKSSKTPAPTPVPAPGTVPAPAPDPGFRNEPGGRMEVSTPAQTPVPTPPPTPAPEAKIFPQPAPGKAAPAAIPRSVPAANAEQTQLGLADALYSRQQWDAAIEEYQRFLADFPRSAQLAPAIYRLAEAYEKIGNANSARLYYAKVAALSQPGPFGGAAAYKLAEAEFQERDYANAVAHYKLAAQLLPEPKAKQSAQYFTARCLQELSRKQEARAAYQALADTQEKHPFREVSQFQLAVLLVDAGRSSEALPRFQKLETEAESTEIRAESVTRAALLTLEADPKKALPALEKALAFAGTEKWHGALRLGVLKSCFALGDNQKVIDAYAAAESAIDAVQLPEVQLLVGDAHRQLKQYTEASALYSKLIEAAPQSSAAPAARYGRLVCYYSLERSDLPLQIDAFLSTNPKAQDRDNAQLMKAEVLRVRGDYAGSAAAYAEVVKSKELKPERRNEALMRWAECAVRTGDNEATVTATTELLKVAPKYPLASTALLWRAETRRRMKQAPAAEKDYEELLKRFPDFAERETVLKQVALLKGEQNDNAGMAQYFTQLLKEFPESKSRAEANHWIGRTAFEAKDYKKAADYLDEARKLNPEEYFESDSLRLVYCAYHLNEPDNFWKRVQEYRVKGKNRVAQDVLRWCAQNYLDAKQFEKAEPVLSMISEGEELTESDWYQLATVRLSLKNYAGTHAPVKAYLGLVSHPSAKARGMLLRAKAELGQGDAAAAQKTVDEAIRLQPDGVLNAEARMVAADIQMAQKNPEAAAKLFESISIAFDDDQLAPLAMEKAVQAYRSAGKLKETQAVLNKLQSRYPEYARERGLK